MNQNLGLLKVRIQRGVNLAVRDLRSSDPYCVLRMGKQKLKTRVMKKNVNPEWDEDLTLCVENPSIPVKLEVFDKDMFSRDDSMGDAEFDIRFYVECAKMNLRDLPNGTVIQKVKASKQNCLAEDSPIYWSDGKVIQNIILRLRNTECGEIELQLQWASLGQHSGG